MTALTAADDGFHPVTDPDPLWTETTWWGFAAPAESLGGMVYTLFRPNAGVASLVVQVWDAAAVEPWLVPFSRSQWHLPMPGGDLRDCSVGGLTMRVLEPLQRYHLAYADDGVALDLEYRGLAEPYAPGARGHFDQACHVAGTVTIGDRTVVVDGPGGRDRSWYVRQDGRSLRAGYTFAVVDATEHVFVHSFAPPDTAEDSTMVIGGYLERDGERADLTAGSRTVINRRRGHPDHISIAVADALGRQAAIEGTVFASMASQSTPGMFAWMSSVAWTIDGRPALGEDHDVWSPDVLTATRDQRL